MVLVAALTTEVLKFFILERPDLVVSRIGDNSYPSGHTTIGMSIAMSALLVVPARLRMVTALGAGAVGAAFGVAVVAAGWHRPSDAVGAYLVCLAASAGAAALIRAYPDRVSADEAAPTLARPLAQIRPDRTRVDRARRCRRGDVRAGGADRARHSMDERRRRVPDLLRRAS